MEQIVRTPQQLGAALRRRRRELGWTQKQLATRVGLRPATISELEAGEVDARFSTVTRLMAALDLEVLVRPRTRGENQLAELF